MTEINNETIMTREGETVISVAQMRAADAYTIGKGTPSKELMRRAAQGVFDAYDGWKDRRTLIICGSGNNGGDGYALASIMHDHGLEADLLTVSDRFSEDGQYYYDICMEKGVAVFSVSDFFLNLQKMQPDARSSESEESRDADRFGAYDIYVDCVFGTGFAGVPREPAASVIQEVNRQRQERGAYVIAVDINSGMNGDTGEAELAVASDLTVSIGYYKHGFFRGNAAELIVKLVNVDIGIELPETDRQAQILDMCRAGVRGL